MAEAGSVGGLGDHHLTASCIRHTGLCWCVGGNLLDLLFVIDAHTCLFFLLSANKRSLPEMYVLN